MGRGAGRVSYVTGSGRSLQWVWPETIRSFGAPQEVELDANPDVDQGNEEQEVEPTSMIRIVQPLDADDNRGIEEEQHQDATIQTNAYLLVECSKRDVEGYSNDRQCKEWKTEA